MDSPDKEIELLMKRTRRAIRFATAMLVLAIASCCTFFIVWKNQIPIPESIEGDFSRGALHRIDVVLVDQPELDDRYLTDLLRPLLMTHEMYRHGVPTHLRVIVMREGMPVGWSADGVGMAGFVKERDVFIVDTALIGKASIKKVLDDQSTYLAFIMGHEGYHRVQWLSGKMTNHQSTAENPLEYAKDPIEQDAFREGVVIGNAFRAKENQFAYTTPEMGMVRAPSINPYNKLVDLKVEDLATVSITHTWTPKGVFRRLLHQLSG